LISILSGSIKPTEVAQERKTGKDANAKLHCAVVADLDSIQNFWGEELPKLGTDSKGEAGG
jgi:hypothetical protein